MELDGANYMGIGLSVTVGGAMTALAAIRQGAQMLKLLLALLAALPTLESDVVSVVNEIKGATDGASGIRNSISALRKLADDLEAAL